MADAAPSHLTLDEFLNWNPPGDTRYELIDGIVRAMAPTSGAHQIIVGALAGEIHAALRAHLGCTVRIEASLILPNRRDTYYQADLAVTCRPHAADERSTPDPILIVEVLSPSTESHDRKVKLPDTRDFDSVQEIVLIDSQRLCCEVHRRLDQQRWLTDLLRTPEARLRLDSPSLQSGGLDLSLWPSSTPTSPWKHESRSPVKAFALRPIIR